METILNNITIDDFFLDDLSYTFNIKLKKDVYIFEKLVSKDKVDFFTRDKELLNKYIKEFITYFNWLNIGIKNDLINTFYEIVNSLNENDEYITLDYINKVNWYNEINIKNIMIYLHDNADFAARVNFTDNYFINHNSEFFIHDNIIELKTYEQYSNDDYTSEEIEDTENNLCKIHNYLMKKKEIRICYGFPIAPVYGYTEDKEKYFFNCDDEILGGCCVSEESPSTELNYVCEECNKEREIWKINHRSEIFIHFNMIIKENFVILLNGKIKHYVKKDNGHNNYWVSIIAIPNGKYKIDIINKLTKQVCANYEVELNNELLNVNIEKEGSDFKFILNYKDQMNAYWY